MDWTREDVDLPSGDFRTTLVTTRLNYSFTPHMFLDALIQYNSTVKEIASNIRFNFNYKPLSDLFLVYNERRSTTGGYCQVNETKPRFSPKRQESCHRSIDARHLSPIGKSPGSEESMMNGLKMMTTDSKKVLARTVNREKTLSLCH